MEAATSKMLYLEDAEIAEAFAIFKAVKMVEKAGISPPIIESDSKNVVNFIFKDISSKGELDWIISENRILAHKNNQYRVVYTPSPRSCNSMAHDLAKIVLSISGSLV